MKRDDLSFVKDPDQWPSWPLCPLIKRKDGTTTVGVLVSDEETVTHGKPTVYLCNMWDFPKTAEEWSKVPSVKYESFAEMLQDGWQVD